MLIKLAFGLFAVIGLNACLGSPPKPSCSEMRATKYEIEIGDMTQADQDAIKDAIIVLNKSLGVSIGIVDACHDDECTKFVYVTPMPNSKEIILATYLGSKMQITKGVWLNSNQATAVFVHELTHKLQRDEFASHSATMHSKDPSNIMYRNTPFQLVKMEELNEMDVAFICSNGN